MSAVPRPFSPVEMSRKVLLTSSFPYASGPLRIRQLVDALQADIYARFLRLVGREVVFVGGADSHGTEVQMNAAAAGVEPVQLADRYCEEHLRDFSALHIEFSAFASTHGEANRELSVLVFNRLKEKGYIYEKEIPLGYCGSCRRFLPARFDRGRCPGCGVAVRDGGLCHVCSGIGHPSDSPEGRCPSCGTEPEQRRSRHYFFRLSEFSGRLASWVRSAGVFQPEVGQWVESRLRAGLDDWCISRDGPYFGFPVPGELKKYFCGWLDAPLGYLSATAGSGRCSEPGREPFWHDGESEIIQFVRRDIIAFHTLFWPAMLMGADFSLPSRIVAQGFLKVDGQRVAGREGPGILVHDLPDRLDSECLRYALAGRLGSGLEEIDISPGRIAETVSDELGGLIRRFLRRTLDQGGADGRKTETAAVPRTVLPHYAAIGEAYAGIDFRRALALIRDVVRVVEGLAVSGSDWPAACRDLAILLSPVLPVLGQEVASRLGIGRPWSWDDLGSSFTGRPAGAVQSLGERLDCRSLERISLRDEE